MKTTEEILQQYENIEIWHYGKQNYEKDDIIKAMKEYTKSVLDYIVNSDKQYIIGKDDESLFDYTEIEKLKEQLQ